MNREGQYILLSHIGPYECHTTVDSVAEEGKQIFMGSRKVQSLLTEKDRIVVNIHGHTHNSPGEAQVSNTQVFNPGAVKNGNYATMTLEQINEKDPLVKTVSSAFNK